MRRTIRTVERNLQEYNKQVASHMAMMMAELAIDGIAKVKEPPDLLKKLIDRHFAKLKPLFDKSWKILPPTSKEPDTHVIKDTGKSLIFTSVLVDHGEKIWRRIK